MSDWDDVPSSAEEAEELIYLGKFELKQAPPHRRARLRKKLEGWRRFARWMRDRGRLAA